MTQTREGIVRELHKDARRNYPRRRIIVTGWYETISGDLIDMQQFSKKNDGLNYILVIIDNMSKYAYAEGLLNKSGPEVTRAMKKILAKMPRTPKHLHTDDGKEFYNKPFKDLMKTHSINLYSTYSGKKSSIAERFIRTLKNKIWPMFNINGNHRWKDFLDQLVHDYNHSKHRTIKMAPADVNETNEQKILKKVYKHIKIYKKKRKFRVGDHVRISKSKAIFEKNYTGNWSTEIFVVSKVRLSNPPVYELNDWEGNPIRGTFYNEELLKTAYPDSYLVDRVLQRKKNLVKVSWLGFPLDKASWIHKDNVL